MKKIIITSAIIAFCFAANAQQDPMFTHYMYNTLAVNPAYAGSRDALTVTALHRSQWVAFDGAPQTQTMTFHTPFFKNKMGVGLSVVNDKIGPSKTTGLYADLAYRIKLSKKAKLAFGIKAGVNRWNTSLSSLKLDNQNDVSFQGNNQSQWLPNFGGGVYYYSDRFYIGMSSPKLLQNDFKSTSANGNGGNEQRHFFGIIGAMFNLSENVKFKPTALVKITPSAPIEGDITGTFVFSDKFNLGAMYRTGDAFGVLLGYNITNQFNIGYSFDWSMANTTGKYNAGSHEIMLRYDFIYKDKEKIRSPRYF
jgi:type IX secretion system PorP/SprF family membrane protein